MLFTCILSLSCVTVCCVFDAVKFSSLMSSATLGVCRCFRTTRSQDHASARVFRSMWTVPRARAQGKRFTAALCYDCSAQTRYCKQRLARLKFQYYMPLNVQSVLSATIVASIANTLRIVQRRGPINLC